MRRSTSVEGMHRNLMKCLWLMQNVRSRKHRMSHPRSNRQLRTLLLHLTWLIQSYTWYRVVAPSGAAMYEFDEEHDFGSDTASREARKPSRILKCGTIVVCTASQNYACDMSSNSDSTHDLPRSQTYLKAPGGWIPAVAMKELMHLKPRKRDAAVDSSKMAHTS